MDKETKKRTDRVCKNVCRTLNLHDYARIDLRLNPEGKIYILEVNPNPDLGYGEEFAESAECGGCSYEELISPIIRLALMRNKNVQKVSIS